MHRILCLEDSEDTILMLKMAMERYHLVFARTLIEASKLIESDSFSLLLVDIKLPDGNGFEFISGLPGRCKNIPVIFLTACDDFSHKVSAFTLGADDFIAKPFDPRELKLRIDSKLRKVNSLRDNDASFSVGDLLCSPAEQKLSIPGKRSSIDLTSLEFRIFRLLAKEPEKVYSREEILRRVWSHNVAVNDRTVDVHVSNLRKKLKGSVVSIDSVIGSGYRLHSSFEHARRTQAKWP